MVGDEFLALLNINEISTIKIDVEGAELEVLSDLQDTIKKFRPYIYTEMLETQQTGRIDKASALITENNYALFGVNKSSNTLERIHSSSEIGSKYYAEHIFTPDEELTNLLPE